MKDKLYRSKRRRIFGGVAAGLGEYFNIDPIIVRIVLILLSIYNGIGLILYIILWIVIPEEPLENLFNMGPGAEEAKEKPFEKTEPAPDINFEDLEGNKQKTNNGRGRILGGAVLIGLGVIFLLDNFLPRFDFADFFPLAIIAVGAALIWHSLKR